MGWYRMEHSNEPLGSQGGSCQGVSSEYSTVKFVSSKPFEVEYDLKSKVSRCGTGCILVVKI